MRSEEDGIRRKVEREMAAHARRTKGRRLCPFLNNFHCRLPGGLYRRIYSRVELHERYLDERAGAKLRRMTAAQFFAHIDAAIAELGLDARKMRRLQNARTLEIHDYAFPLYLRLRQDGFKHYPDLTS